MATPYGDSLSNSLENQHSVPLLWTSYQPKADTSTWLQTTPIRDKHFCPGGGIRTHNPESERRQGRVLDRAGSGVYKQYMSR